MVSGGSEVSGNPLPARYLMLAPLVSTCTAKIDYSATGKPQSSSTSKDDQQRAEPTTPLPKRHKQGNYAW